MTYKDLTGYWTGVYDYMQGNEAPVSFNMAMHDDNGRIYGEIIEPDPDNAPGYLFSSFAGNFSEGVVSFDKLYDFEKRGKSSKLRYTGFVNDELDYIEGSWNFLLKFGGNWSSGNFTMQRNPGESEKAAIKISETLKIK
jgi:hypothetical protein